MVKLLVVLLLLPAAAALAASNDELIAAEARDARYASGWYRDVRMAMWVWEGAERSKIEATLERVRAGDGERRWQELADTQLSYGPGHWTYEFTRTAEEELVSAGSRPSAAALRRAAVYYLIASYPHLNKPHTRQALAKAFDAYEAAGRHLGKRFETWHLQVDGVAFRAFVHLPKGRGPHPVVMKTGGMDVLGIEFLPLADELNRRGAAMVAFDMPGNGNDGVVDPDAHKHHAAVLERILEDSRFDHARIVAYSESLGGLPVVKFAVTHQQHLAAAVNSCGLVHAVHALELFPVPPDVDMAVLVAAHASGSLPAEQVAQIEAGLASSPEFQAQTRSFQFEVYVERVGAASSGVLDIAVKSLPISLVNQGILGKGERTSVPILSINTWEDPIVPTSDSLLATEVSRRPTLALFGDHPGHCASRHLEMPYVLNWLGPYLWAEDL